MAIAMGKTDMYIITSKLNCTPGWTVMRLKEEVPVCREEAAWNMAAASRGPAGKWFTVSLFRSRTMIRRMSTKFNAKRIPKRTQVGRLGKSSV
jgi:hypothetical protein